jgi:hypothetical protein
LTSHITPPTSASNIFINILAADAVQFYCHLVAHPCRNLISCYPSLLQLHSAHFVTNKGEKTTDNRWRRLLYRTAKTFELSYNVVHNLTIMWPEFLDDPLVLPQCIPHMSVTKYIEQKLIHKLILAQLVKQLNFLMEHEYLMRCLQYFAADISPRLDKQSAHFHVLLP